MGLPKRSKSRVLSVEELLQESKEKQQSRLRYRSPQLPGFQIPSELPTPRKLNLADGYPRLP